MLTLWKESYDQPRQHIEKQRYCFANKGPSGQGYGFSSSHVWMWGLDYKERWVPNSWCFWTVVLEKTLECPLDYKEIQPVHPKEISTEYSLERLMLMLKTPILWPPDAKKWLLGKDPNSGKDLGQEEKGTTEDVVVGCHHCLSEHEFEQVPGVDDGQRGLECCRPWGRKYSDTTEWLNWTELKKRRCAGEILYFSFLKGNFLFLRLLPPWWQKRHNSLSLTGSVTAAHGLTCSKACGVPPDQRWNSCLLQWQMHS